METYRFQFYKVRLKQAHDKAADKLEELISILQSSIKAGKEGDGPHPAHDCISILQSSIKAEGVVERHQLPLISILQSSIKAQPPDEAAQRRSFISILQSSIKALPPHRRTSR